MSTDTPPLPDFLEDRLQEESPDVQSDLGAVWRLLEGAGASATELADAGAAWDALTEEHPELKAPPTDGAGAADDAKTEAAPFSRRRQRPARRSQSHSWRVAVGLTVAALVLVGGLWLWQQPVTVTAPPGQQRTATLPDGSTAHLNSGTSLTYQRGFEAWPFVDADRRAVTLDGEAFFEVADGNRPFAIETASAEVAVTGTRFNVRARPKAPDTEASSPETDSPETEVTLVEGRVEVAARARPDERVVLSTPGQASRVASPDAAPSPPESTPVKHVLAWRNNGFAARAEPLAAVLQDLERRFDTTLRLHESVEETQAPISLYYPEATDLETILHDLCTARDLNYRPTSRGFEVFAASTSR
jgi:ferric-dicitrate binding protein FerR (iron transport regulator)